MLCFDCKVDTWCANVSAKWFIHVVLFVRQRDDRNGSEGGGGSETESSLTNWYKWCVVLLRGCAVCCLWAALEDSVTRACGTHKTYCYVWRISYMTYWNRSSIRCIFAGQTSDPVRLSATKQWASKARCACLRCAKTRPLRYVHKMRTDPNVLFQQFFMPADRTGRGRTWWRRHDRHDTRLHNPPATTTHAQTYR